MRGAVSESAPNASGASDLEAEAFVRLFQHRVWRYLRLLGAAPADASDLTQDTLVRFLAQHSPSRAAGPLLRTMARGMFLDQQRWYRRRRVEALADQIDSWATASPETERAFADDWLDALRACREVLQPRARRVLDLFYRDDLPRREVGRRLGIGDHGTRNLLTRTRQTLKTCIQRRLDAEGER